jgi:hypothetical protein
MRINMANVVVHIDENLTDDQIRAMEKDLAYEQGVYSACVHEKTPHLMVVDYDPTETRAQNLLQDVRRHQIHAELIGF